MGQALTLTIGLALASTAAVLLRTAPPELEAGGDSPAGRAVERIQERHGAEELVALPPPSLRGRRRHRRRGPARVRSAVAADVRTHLARVSGSADAASLRGAAAEVRKHFERGQAYEDEESFDAAVEAYQKALAIASWCVDRPGFGRTAAGLLDLIDAARLEGETRSRRTGRGARRAAQMQREQELAGERERRLHEIRACFDEAHRAFRRGESVLAHAYARHILLLDPRNLDAQKLILISYDKLHDRTEAESRRLYDDQWKSVFADLERRAIPNVCFCDFPVDWLEAIAQRTPDVVGDEHEEGDADIAAILTTLDTKRVKGLTWEAASLDQVVQYLRTITGVDFFITAKVRAEVFDEVEVTLDLDDVSVATVLDLATDPYELRWTPENGVVKITTRDERTRGPPTRYFDAKDVLRPVETFVGDSWLPSAPPTEPVQATESPGYPTDEELLDLIRESTGGSPVWRTPAALEVRNRIVIARNAPRILDEVGAYLHALRAELEATGDLRAYRETRRWSTVTGAPPR